MPLYGYILALKVLNFGLKSSRAFQKRNVYIWDIIEKCLEDLPSSLGDVPLHEEEEEERTEEDHLRGDGPTHTSSQELLRNFINIVSRINGFSKIGKQEKVSDLKNTFIIVFVIMSLYHQATMLFSIGLRYYGYKLFVNYYSVFILISKFFQRRSFGNMDSIINIFYCD